MGKLFKQTFHQIKYMDNKHMRSCSIALSLEKMQIKFTMKQYYTLMRITKVKLKLVQCQVLTMLLRKQLSNTAGGNIKLLLKIFKQFLKMLNILLPYDPFIYLLGIYQRKGIYVHTYIYVHKCS